MGEDNAELLADYLDYLRGESERFSPLPISDQSFDSPKLLNSVHNAQLENNFTTIIL
jgi:hypothetical protein